MPFSGIPQNPAFSVHVDDDITHHTPATPQHVSQFDKVLSSRKPDKPSVMDALRNKVNLLYRSNGNVHLYSLKYLGWGAIITNEHWNVS